MEDNTKVPYLYKILVCVDESPAAEAAFIRATELVERNTGEIYVLHVAEIVTKPRVDFSHIVNPLEDRLEFVNTIEQREIAQKVRARYETLFEDVDRDRFTYIGAEAPSANEEICRQAAELGDVDLVVVGSRGAGRLSRLLLGSTAEYVINHCPCSVLVVKGHLKE